MGKLQIRNSQQIQAFGIRITLQDEGYSLLARGYLVIAMSYAALYIS